MKEDLERAIKQIRSGKLHSEAHVKQTVIVPILRGLGWNDADSSEFVPEYSTPPPASGRVDYALFHPTATQ